MQRNQLPFDCQQKIVLAGDHNVGKTSLLIRYTENTFERSSLLTIGIEFKFKIVKVQDLQCKLQIWDRAGAERFRSLNTSYYRLADGIIIMYDVSNRHTFNSVPTELQDIQEAINRINPQQQISNVQYMLIGSKIDLSNRQVSLDEGQQFANENNMMFIEVSSLSSENVNMAFESLVQQMIVNKLSIQSKQSNDQPQKNLLISSPPKRYNCI